MAYVHRRILRADVLSDGWARITQYHISITQYHISITQYHISVTSCELLCSAFCRANTDLSHSVFPGYHVGFISSSAVPTDLPAKAGRYFCFLQCPDEYS